ncbi:hypothetical protein GOODEAATRI_026788 [Goodea atripinnis]|uniref:Uncharacterized protein n=1 Tax=Goodea atripinnis TaxID=208336 RepID=A0ABV0PRX9_9TELE
MSTRREQKYQPTPSCPVASWHIRVPEAAPAHLAVSRKPFLEGSSVPSPVSKGRGFKWWTLVLQTCTPSGPGGCACPSPADVQQAPPPGPLSYRSTSIRTLHRAVVTRRQRWRGGSQPYTPP